MASAEAFAELLRRHEDLTQRFAALLHDDAGQVLTAVALELSVLEDNDPEGRLRLQAALDDLLERFRSAQSSLGAAVVAQRGLAAGLSLLARSVDGLRIKTTGAPAWPRSSQLGAFRIVEALRPQSLLIETDSIELGGAQPVDDYARALAGAANLTLYSSGNPHTIKICHGHPHTHR